MKAAALKLRGRKIAERLACAAGLAIAAALFVAVPSSAQNQVGGNGAARQMHEPMPDEILAGPIGDPVFQERRLRQLSIANHKSMVSDTDKLLQLVTELSNEVGNTNPRSFTPEELRKIAMIEKLAHNVKDKMRISFQGPQDTIEAIPGLPRSTH
jgi:hypothetical protein